eukprot:1320682-Ditylum_brightwellii.AAC.1
MRALQGQQHNFIPTAMLHTRMKEVFIAKSHGFNHVGTGINGNGDGDGQTLLPEGLDTSDFKTWKIVVGCWVLMLLDVKDAWKERAHKLNQQYLQGQFEVLPAAYAAMTPADTL